MTVVLGADNPTEKDPPRGKRIRKLKVKSVLVHEKYSSDTRSAYYDVAIVEVPRISFSRKFGNIWPICIPEKINTDRNHLSRQGITVLGYGPASKDKESGKFSI